MKKLSDLRKPARAKVKATRPRSKERSSPLHVSVYVSEEMAKEFKLVAAEHGCRPHDLYKEGFEMVLQKYRPGLDLTKV